MKQNPADRTRRPRPCSKNAFIGVLCGLLILIGGASAAEVIPPAPKKYFNDYAGVTKPATAQRLESELTQFEREQSVQIVVAVFPKLPDGAALEDFTVRTAAAWKVGRQSPDNGAVLFVFIQDRKMRIEIGYGLEGKIPDALAKRITSEKIKPLFQRGDYDGGIEAGTRALMQAARGEYKGDGLIVNQSRPRNLPWPLFIFLGLFVMMAIGSFSRRARGTAYSRRGRSNWGAWPVIIPGSLGGGGGGDWSSGGGGGGGFSGGGGDFGGGGASDSW